MALPLQANPQAPDVDTSAWQCQFCTYASGWFGSLEIGPGYVSDSSLKFGDYRGLDEDGAFLSLSGEAHYRNGDGRYFDLYARDLGTDSRQLEARGGRAGRYQLHLDYSEVPRYLGISAQSPFLGAGGNVLSLPAGWVAADTTAGMNELGASLHAARLSTKRKNLEAGLDIRLSGSWQAEVGVRHMEKDGTRPFGAGVFTLQSAQLPAPVDFKENQVGIALNYSGHRSHLRLSYDSSYFNNGQAFMTWQNPFNPVGNTAFLRSSLEPDSSAHRLGVSAVFAPGSMVRLSAQASVGRSRQDDAFLPYSINPDFDEVTLPRAALGGKIDSSSLNLATRLNARLSRKLNLSLRMKADERDNDTPVDLFTPVITDLVERPPTANRPYSYERRQYALELDYRLGRAGRLNSGVRREERERTLQSVRKTRQTTWWGELSFHQWSMAQLRLRLESSERDISPYETVNDPGLQENPLMRKFNLAGRDRERLTAEFDLAPSARLNLGFSYHASRDDYDQSLLGLMKSREESYNLDLGYSLSQRISLYAFASRDRFSSDISGAIFDGATPWLAKTEDRFTTLGAGLSGQINERFEFGIDLLHSQAKGLVATDSGAGEAPFPELFTRLINTRLKLAYRAEGPWSWILSAEHEKYDSRDWQIDGLGQDGLEAILTFGLDSPDLRVLLLRLHAQYRF